MGFYAYVVLTYSTSDTGANRSSSQPTTHIHTYIPSRCRLLGLLGLIQWVGWPLPVVVLAYIGVLVMGWWSLLRFLFFFFFFCFCFFSQIRDPLPHLFSHR
ncbi:uncharacterized protein F4812DRAFT_27729 [Daldinia caldariorum]|uniref:uncharacterized protein n=1 Tax=Daldinia caldariorum TaxID=326644 RepID=UPI002007B687|nr:uncharacterized protein F4812DRAFT_27729 [Daldinia caldariorum]KAI1472820.1 hypothetical protein F4812DRAFT_27729 [Daldinia caldariorum]